MQKSNSLSEDQIIQIPLSFSSFWIRVIQIGEDLQVLFGGGERPHIGCTVMAVPRLSLTGDGSVSVTSSVMNLTGHKDENVCRLLAEKYCRREGCVVVCSGGFHMDGITPDQIRELMSAVEAV